MGYIRTMRLSRRLLYSLLPVLLLLGGLELAGRRVRTGEIAWNVLEPHPTRGWTLPTSAHFEFGGQAVVTNALGLRSPSPDPDAQRRVLVLGDSTAFGDGVGDRETFASQLAALTGLDVQNAGVPGYTCPQSRDRYDDLVEALEPAMVVVYSMNNDARMFHSEDELWMGTLPSRSGLLRLLAYAQLKRRVARGETRVSLDGYRRCLEGLVHAQERRGGQTLLLVPVSLADFQGVPPAQRSLSWSYRQVVEQVSARTRAPMMDLGDLAWTFGAPADVVLLDEVHPSARGHMLLAQQLRLGLAELGFLEGGR